MKNKVIMFSEEELNHLDKKEINAILRFKRYAKNLMAHEYNKYCPICKHLLRERVIMEHMPREHYCEWCELIIKSNS